MVTGKGNMAAGKLRGQESGLPFSSALKQSKYTDRVPSSQFNFVAFESVGKRSDEFTSQSHSSYVRKIAHVI